MVPDKMYELAFEYKKTRLWKKLTDTYIFAVKLSDGAIGYICIMGYSGKHCALALYVGEDAFNGWQSVFYNLNDSASPYQNDCFFLQDCLQCEFTTISMLSDEEYKSARAYASEHGIRTTGINAYPNFVKYSPECYPWHLQSAREQEQLCEALSAAIKVAELLDEGTEIPELTQLSDEKKYIPLLELKDGGYVIGKTEVPVYIPYKFPEPELNDIYSAKLQRAKRTGIWECEIIRIPEPFQSEPDAAPRYSNVLMAIETRSHAFFPMTPIVDYIENSVSALNDFAEYLYRENVCPRSIRVRDNRTYVLIFQIILQKIKNFSCCERRIGNA